MPAQSTPAKLPGWEDFAAITDPFGIADSWRQSLQSWLTHPDQFGERYQQFATDWLAVNQQIWQRLCGITTGDAIPVIEHDERFHDPAWSTHPGFDALKEIYLLHTRALVDAIYASPGLDTKTAQRAAFWVKQWLDAVAPSNFFWTNPTAIDHALESNGESLRQGAANFARDLAAGDVLMVDPHAFTLGRDLATTPGEVVLRNELLELIQYTPTTPQVRSMPVLIVAPWINKFYILDLKPRNSLVRYLVSQGFTVFVTSWKNPGPEARDTGFEDYLIKGVLAAVDTAREITGAEQIHAVGYCLGGTTLTSLMAWFAADAATTPPIAHWTLFTTLTDFSDPGEIGVFLSEAAVEFIEQGMAGKGYLDGREMARSFRMLRPNSLIWHYVVHSYLYGEALPAFDVLFWNMDATRMPAAMHSWYLRELYLGNHLAQGALTIAGRRLDLGSIRQPLYAVGCEQDHIAPWKQTFRTCGLVCGPVRYVLATSGHILGIINPPVDPPKRRYWVGDASGCSDAEQWRASIAKVPGSWWEDWTAWLHERCGEWRDAPAAAGSAGHPPLAAAPGCYVLEK